MKVTLKEIAKMAGVSHPTVSKALNNEQGVSKETKEKIISIAKQYNYMPSYLAKRNIERKMNVIGLAWPKVEGLFFHHLCNEIQKEAAKKDINILVSFADVGDALVLFNECNVDKVAVWLVHNWVPDIGFLSKRDDFKGNLVVLGGGRLQQAHHITVNRKAGIFKAVEYLAGLGHQRIAFFSEGRNDKLLGFTQGLLEFKLEYCPEYIVMLDDELNNIREVFSKLLEDNIRPTALIIDSQGILFKVNKLLKEYKLRIPDDFSVLVYDDIPEMEIFDTPITAIGPSLKKLAKETVNILTTLENEKNSELIEIEIMPELTVRASTRKLSN